jgi:polysaccharide export outer membrane protein
MSALMSMSVRHSKRVLSPRVLSAVLPLALLAGCNTLPDSGPVEARILNSEKKPETNPMGFRIVPLTPTVVTALAAASPPEFSALVDRMDGRGQNDRIGAGDVLQVSIFELGSGLFAGGGGLASGAANPLTGGPGPSASVTSENLPPIVVGDNGAVDVPYVGRLQASGRTTAQLASAIQAGLKGQSQNPQVLVRIATDIANAVIVSGDIRKPGRQPLTLAHERLLDMVAIAGGPTHPPEDVTVQLTRSGRSARIPLETLQDSPDQNIALLPGDRIQVSTHPRTFTVFGASAKVSEAPFNAPQLSLAEALARIGGPLDERADPNAVFLFRFENPRVAGSLGLPIRAGVQAAPVVYQLDMMNPTSYFLAQRFAMKDKDLVYIANAKTNKFYKFFNLISMLVSPAITAAYVTKD